MPDYKNSFSAPSYREETIVDENGRTVGTLRIKPSSILWKPSGAQSFHAVPLDTFTDWITSAAAIGSKRAKQ